MKTNLLVLLYSLLLITVEIVSEPAQVLVKLDSIKISANVPDFTCHQPYGKYNGLCDFEVFLYACSCTKNVTSVIQNLGPYNKYRYHNRYTWYLPFQLNDLVLDIFESNSSLFECPSERIYVHSYYQTMFVNFSNYTNYPKIEFVSRYWKQKIIIWLQIWTVDFLVLYPANVWFAEFILNDKFVDNKGYVKPLVIKKSFIHFGRSNNIYGFYDLNLEINIHVSFKCINNGYGPLCSTRCQPTVYQTCDQQTGDAICNKGYIPRKQKTKSLDLPYFTICSTADPCYNNNCTDKQCLIIPDGSNPQNNTQAVTAVCEDIEPNIVPDTTCIPVQEVIECVYTNPFSYKLNWTTKWDYIKVDGGANISGNTIVFDRAIVKSQSYFCTVIFKVFIYTQTFSLNVTFHVYDVNYVIDFNIYDGHAYLGQIINCTVDGWNPNLINFTMYSDNNEGLMLDEIDNGIYVINPKSRISKYTLFCVANLSFECDKPPITTEINKTVLLQVFSELTWFGGEKNVFDRNITENPFECRTVLNNTVATITVTILHRPKVTDNNVILNHTLIPGIYHAACTLSLNGSTRSFTIYKYIQINYFPTTSELKFVTESNTLDSKLQCLPLPFPVEDYEYTLTIYSGWVNTSILGIFNTHTLGRMPYISRGSSKYIFRCTIKSKFRDPIEEISKNFKIQLKGWQHPITLKYVSWRVWGNSFFMLGTTIVLLLSLSWIIFAKLMRSISGTYLTKRTKAYTNLKRRNFQFYKEFIKWIESTNVFFRGIGMAPLSDIEAYTLLQTDPSVSKNFFQFIVEQPLKNDDFSSIKENNKLFLDALRRLRKTIS